MADSSPDRSAASSSGATTDAPARSDQRRNLVLRELVDEMMASIRAAAGRELWSPEERTQYEDELAMIMMRVRKEAVHITEKRQPS